MASGTVRSRGSLALSNWGLVAGARFHRERTRRPTLAYDLLWHPAPRARFTQSIVQELLVPRNKISRRPAQSTVAA